MPVTFEQPDPAGFLSGPAQAGGYVQQYNADRQFALQAAALQAHAAQANAAMQMQNRLGTAQLQQHGMAMSQQGQVTPAQQFQAQEQRAAMAQHGEQQQALQSQQFGQQQQLMDQQRQQGPPMFSQGDYLNLQKLQNGRSEIDKQLANGMITQDEADQQSGPLDQQIQSLTGKRDQFESGKLQKMNQMKMHQTAADTTIALQNDALVAKAAGATDGSNRVPIDPNDPSKGHAGIIVAGKFHAFNAGAIKAAMGAEEEKDDGLTDKEYMDHYEKISKAVDDRLLHTAGKDEQGKQNPPDMSQRRDAINQDLKDAGLAANLDEHRAKRGGKKAGAPVAAGPKPEATGLIPPMDDPQKEADAYQAIYNDKPIPPHVKARLRQLKVAVDARKGMVQAPGETVAQPATRQPPEQSWGQWAAGMLPSGGNVGVSGGDRRYR